MAKKDIRRDAARAAREKAGGVVDKAVPILKAAIKKSPTLYKAFVEPWLDHIVRTALNEDARQERAAIARKADNLPPSSSSPSSPSSPMTGEPPVSPVRPPGSTTVVGRYMLSRLPLPGGLPVMDAYEDDLVTAISHYTKQGTTMLKRADWLKLILPAIAGTKKKVSTAIGADLEKVLQEKWDEVGGDA